MKRTFDVIAAVLGLIFLFPFFVFVAAWVNMESKGGIFYRQRRIGKNGQPFMLLKFRSMFVGSDKSSRITVGNRDSRITKSGQFIRKYKLDEFPQLVNVINGDMSIVGPRPEVEEYVKMYSEEQKKVLTVKPGISDFASIEYMDENELLAKSENPQKTYIDEIMPLKLELNLKYIREQSLRTDLKIIMNTIIGIFSSNR